MTPTDQTHYCALCSRPGPAAGFCEGCALLVERHFEREYIRECCEGHDGAGGPPGPEGLLPQAPEPRGRYDLDRYPSE